MSTTSAIRGPGVVGGGGWVVFALLVFGSMATAAGVIAGNGNLAVAVAPVLVIALVGLMWVAPIRITLLALTFFSLVLDAKGDGPWNSPLTTIGSLLAINMNKTIAIPALAVPGVTVVFGCLLLIHIHRRIRGVRTDSAGRSPITTVSLQSLVVSGLAIVALCALGLSR
ncbi:MAG: hypothetical protein ABIQ52_18105, partial [Vicinamibacterales bacterium]